MEMAARVTQLQQHDKNRLEPSPELAHDPRECNSASIAATTAEANLLFFALIKSVPPPQRLLKKSAQAHRSRGAKKYGHILQGF
jgi:hypothetical protein